MNSTTSTKIINQTIQYLPNGQQVSLTFNYAANLKIGDIINVTAPREVMQLFDPQHKEGSHMFEVDIWDDRIKLHCDLMEELKIYSKAGAVFAFKIKAVELFANRFSSVSKAELYN